MSDGVLGICHHCQKEKEVKTFPHIGVTDPVCYECWMDPSQDLEDEGQPMEQAKDKK